MGNDVRKKIKVRKREAEIKVRKMKVEQMKKKCHPKKNERQIRCERY